MPSVFDFFPFLETSPLYRYWKLGLLIVLGVSWLAMIAFVSKDSERRINRESVRLLSTFLPVLFHVVGFFIYLIFRPGLTIAERSHQKYFLERLAEESCPTCHRPASDDYIYCPYCSTELGRRCPKCKHAVRNMWQLCPKCGHGFDHDRVLD